MRRFNWNLACTSLLELSNVRKHSVNFSPLLYEIPYNCLDKFYNLLIFQLSDLHVTSKTKLNSCTLQDNAENLYCCIFDYIHL